MTKSQKIQFITQKLNEYYPDPQIPLDHKDNYTLLIATVLSAQCTDLVVNATTPRLFKKADTPQKMLKLEESAIQQIIRPCGLSNTKAKNIKKLTQIILEKHNGEVPQTMTELLELPGVGRKVASVVLTQAFNIPAFPVDTHIHRLAYRWTLSTGKNPDKTESDLKKLFPKEDWNKVHLQIIYFGREHCPARNHNMSECPICSVVGRKSLIK